MEAAAHALCKEVWSLGLLVSTDAAETVPIGSSGGYTGLHLIALARLAHSHALQLLCLELRQPLCGFSPEQALV